VDVISPELRTPLIDLLLSLADDKFMLGHRNAEWTGLAPILEEDIAFSSLAQDDLAHALALYELVGALTGDEADRIAYGRRPEEYRCAALVVIDDGFDWAVALARQFLCDHFDFLRLSRLAHSVYRPLRELAARMVAEERLSIGHADQWIVRLGRARGDAPQRMQAALDRIAPLVPTLLEPTAGVEALEASGLYPPLPEPIFDRWCTAIGNIIEEAGLRLELSPPAAGQLNGRRGRHGPEFAALLEELTEVYRVEPEAKW
jgi:ring-1,2-phenylacetyl-CoA epoxidase subunit PaaC